MKGQCLCGKISFKVTAEPVMMVKCHCRDCQYISGGEASPIVFFPKDGVEFSGEAKTYSKSGDSGKSVHRSFCPECGVHVYSMADVAEGMVFIKAGTLEKEDAAKLKTAMVFFTKSANPFSHIDEDAQTFETSP